MKTVILTLVIACVNTLKIGNKAVSGSMSCMECVMNSHNFCLKGKPWSSVKVGEDAPKSVCCPSKGCSGGEDKNPEFTCYEDYFKSVDLAITACPQYEEDCGSSRDFYFRKIGDT